MHAKTRTIHLVGAQETNYPWGVENRLIKAFKAAGHKIISTDFRKNRGRLDSLLARPADLVLVCRGEGIDPALITSIPYPTALWYAEQLGTVHNTNQEIELRRREFAYNCRAFDKVFVHDATSLDVCRELGARDPIWLTPAAVDPDIQKRIQLPKKHDVVFVGSKTARRKRFLTALEQHVAVESPEVWDQVELNKLYNESKILLNIHLSDQPNTEVRLWEVLGAGGFVLTEAISMPELFRDGEHVASFPLDDAEACAEKIRYYLAQEPERAAIADAGYTLVHGHHTFEMRVNELLVHVESAGSPQRWPGFGLGVLHDRNGQRTLQLESFYEAVAASLSTSRVLINAKPGEYATPAALPAASAGIVLELEYQDGGLRVADPFSATETTEVKSVIESVLSREKIVCLEIDAAANGDVVKHVQALVPDDGALTERIILATRSMHLAARLRRGARVVFLKDIPSQRFGMFRQVNYHELQSSIEPEDTCIYGVDSEEELEQALGHGAGWIVADGSAIPSTGASVEEPTGSSITAVPAASKTAPRDAALVGTPVRKPLRIFAAFSNVNWEDYNLQPALKQFGEVYRFYWEHELQYAENWHREEKRAMNDTLLTLLKAEHAKQPFDVFFGYLSGRTVFTDIIREIGALGIPTLNISLDDQHKFEGQLEETGHSGLIDIAPEFSLCWTTARSALEKYRQQGAKVIHMPPASNPDRYTDQKLVHDIDVSFVGSAHGRRRELVESLRREGIDVQTFGRGWPGGEISFDEMVSVFNRSKINLGFAATSGPDAVMQVKGRDFEIPMCGAFYLTQEHDELSACFEPNVEIGCYAREDDLLARVRHFLANDGERDQIRHAGRRRAHAEHTWERRFERAFVEMGVLDAGAKETPQAKEPTIPSVFGNLPVMELGVTTNHSQAAQNKALRADVPAALRSYILSKADIRSVVCHGEDRHNLREAMHPFGIRVDSAVAAASAATSPAGTNSTAPGVRDDCVVWSVDSNWIQGGTASTSAMTELLRLSLQYRYVLMTVCGTDGLPADTQDRQRFIEFLEGAGLPFVLPEGADTTVAAIEHAAFDLTAQLLAEYGPADHSSTEPTSLSCISEELSSRGTQPHVRRLASGNLELLAVKFADPASMQLLPVQHAEAAAFLGDAALLPYVGESPAHGHVFLLVEGLEDAEPAGGEMIGATRVRSGLRFGHPNGVLYLAPRCASLQEHENDPRREGSERSLATIAKLLQEGEAQLTAGDLNRAKLAFQKVLAIDCRQLDSLKHLGDVARQEGDAELADAYSARARAIDAAFATPTGRETERHTGEV